MSRATEIVSQMTNEEKALLLSGKDFWHLVGFEKYGLPSIMVTDGPHGLRKQDGTQDHLGLNNSVPSVCFPTACTTACSFDEDLIYKMGQALAEECHQQGVSVLLGPGVNHKRSPLCGRNFEYFSEDPLLSGTLGAAFVNGVQSKNVGTSLKHFAGNNQEYARFLCDSIIDERTLREIYLKPFEIVVNRSQPWTIMTAYNKLNGTYCSENKWLMEDVARKEWGFKGAFITDWGAMSDVTASYQNGQDLEMPGSCKSTDEIILAALNNGDLSQQTLDDHAVRLVELILKCTKKPNTTCDVPHHLKLAQHIAEESAVLLKNDGLLPYSQKQGVALIGKMARNPRYQGAGSSKINPVKLDNAYDAFRSLGIQFDYADGYEDESIEPNNALISQAAKVAQGKDIVFLFAGLPDSYESEGYDRSVLDLPSSHNRLIEAVLEVNDNVVIILQCGSPVAMPWADRVKAILLTYLGGCQSGKATANLLLGHANPSGKLAETFPLCLKDTPCFRHFANDKRVVQYRESLFTGYRYYDTAKKDVLFPFGHGLSYTTFSYSSLELNQPQITENDALEVRLKVKNTGQLAGKDAVQLYIRHANSSVFKPDKELKAFAKVTLAAEEEKEIVFVLGKDAFSYYNVGCHDWQVDTGEYEILIGASSRDIRLSAFVHVTAHKSTPDQRALYPSYFLLPHTEGTLDIPQDEFVSLVGKPLPKPQKGKPFHLDTPVYELRSSLIGRIFVRIVKATAIKSMQASEGDDVEKMVDAMVMDLPVRAIGMTGGFTKDGLNGLVEILNRRFFKGIQLLRKKKH